MSTSVTLATCDGRPVAIKRADDEVGTARIAAELALLREIRLPGVVELIDGSESPAELVTAFAGQPARQLAGVPARLISHIVATIARTVAALHEQQIAHNRIDASHVLVGAGGEARLCGFAEASDASPESRADDVAGLGRLLRDLVGDVGDGDPIPERRSFRSWRRAMPSNWERRALLTLADQATADEPGHRPPAHRLADLIGQTVPVSADGATPGPRNERRKVLASMPASVERPVEPPDLMTMVVPDTPADLLQRDEGPSPTLVPSPSTPPDDSEPRLATMPRYRRAATALVGAAGMALLVAGVIGLLPRSTSKDKRDNAIDAPAPAEAVDANAGPATSEATTTTTTTEQARCLPAEGPDLDGDACADAVRVAGNVVEVGRIRFVVGRDGDQVTVGDWDCDGIVTAAVLRPGTGEVFVFAGWAGDTDLIAHPVIRLPGTKRLVADADDTGCDGLVAHDGRGRPTSIRVHEG